MGDVARSSFRTRDGLRIATLRWPGAGPPLYLMHATGFCAALWDPIARALGAGLEPRAMDERGHGESDKPGGDYPWSRFADDLLDWLDAERASGAFAMGHSCGATAVLLAAAAAPGRFARILLVDPVLLPPPAERDADERQGGFGLAERTLRRRARFDSIGAAREALGSRFPYSAWRADVLELYLEHAFRPAGNGAVELRCPPEIESAVYRGTAAVDPWAEMARVRARTRVLLPKLSGTRPELQARLAAALPAAEIERVPGSHFVAMEAPDVVAAHARAFFG
jgi:pimeloyl-ACP methyl ester carboxylesterase